MNDTHGETGKGWYGFDLDGTLAKYDGWKGIDHIGEPVGPMVKLIRQMHDEGKVVKIMTARVAPKEKPEVKPNPYLENHWVIESPDDMPWALKNEWSPLEFIQDWCYKILGFVPEIVYQKDHLMLELYDDRVKQVVPNEGWLIEDIAMSKRHVYVRREVEQVDIRWPSRILCFLLGVAAACLLVFAAHVYVAATTTVPEAEQKLSDAVQGYIQSKLHERAGELLR
jgi:hypothetical protein